MRADEYERKLRRLREINPGHDIIPVLEEMGFTRLSVEYLKMALEDPVETSREELTADAIFKKKDSLYSRRAAYSNKFHTCTTDQERAQISIAIKSLQAEIIEIRRMIDEYTTTGKLPKLEQMRSIPMDGRAQELKLRSVRSSISRYRNLIRAEKDPEKIKKYEHSIDQLSILRSELSA